MAKEKGVMIGYYISYHRDFVSVEDFATFHAMSVPYAKAVLAAGKELYYS